MEPNETAAIDKGMRVLRAIWAAMLGSLCLYLFICHQFGDQIRAKADVPLDIIRQALYLFSVVDILIAYHLRRMILSGKFAPAKQRPRQSDLLRNQPPLVAKYAAAMIVALALSESIGIFGLVLFILGDTYPTLHIFISISAASMFYFRPKPQELERMESNFLKHL